MWLKNDGRMSVHAGLCAVNSDFKQISSSSLFSFPWREVHDSSHPDAKSWYHLWVSLLHDGLVSISHYITLLAFLPYLPVHFTARTPISKWDPYKCLCSSPHLALASTHPASVSSALITSLLISKPFSSSQFSTIQNLGLPTRCFLFFKVFLPI